jgi:integrase
VDRLDMLRGTLTVDRQLTGRTPDGSPVFGPVKTPASARAVPLPDALRDVLAAHLAEHGAGPGGLVFTTARSGGPFTRGVRAETWARAVRGLELPPAVRGWHALRHTYASTLLAAGTDLAVVSRLLGHATVTETATTYAHVLPGRTDAARNVAADALRIG